MSDSAPPPEDLDLSGEDPVASAQRLGPGLPRADDASLKEALALARDHLEGLKRRASAALEDVLDSDASAEVPDLDDASVELDLSTNAPDLAASSRGIDKPAEGPPADHSRMVALLLLLIFGLCLGAVVILATVIAWHKPDALKDIVAFYGTIVATLGTLIGGVVAFYFARR
jgi:hypothetical protein